MKYIKSCICISPKLKQIGHHRLISARLLKLPDRLINKILGYLEN